MRPFEHINERRGVATVLVVGVLVFFLIAFIVLAIDLSFIYVVRGELQNAADAAALAGASVIEDSNDPGSVALAKAEAKKFARENFAAGEGVVVDDADITVGSWDGGPDIEADPPFADPPFNAVKVVARRTDNPVPLFFGRIIGKESMKVSRVAIASNPARAEAPIALCFKACGSGIVNSSGSTFILGPTSQEQGNPFAAAFTDFAPDSPVTPGSVVQFFCGKSFNACEVEINTNQTGGFDKVGRQFRCAFLNPMYDSNRKVCDLNGTEVSCLTPGAIVKSWTVLIPLVGDPNNPDGATGCPPGNQPDLKLIVGYAQARIINVHARPGGTSGASDNNCACQALGEETYNIPSPVKELAVIINSINCVKCGSDDIKDLLGRSPYLVK